MFAAITFSLLSQELKRQLSVISSSSSSETKAGEISEVTQDLLKAETYVLTTPAGTPTQIR